MLFLVIVIIIVFTVGFVVCAVLEGKKDLEMQKESKMAIERELEETYFNFDKTFSINHKLINTDVIFDTLRDEIAICNYAKNVLTRVEINAIIECEVLADNSTVLEGGAGRAVVGGLLAGGVGAIVGANTRKSSDVVNSMAIKIVTSDVSLPLIMIDLIETATHRDTQEYKDIKETAIHIHSTIISILNKGKNPQPNAAVKDNNSIPARLKKVEELYSNNVITEEEYINARQKILESV